MLREEAKTIKKRCESNKISKALISGANINIADKYCAKIIIGML
ncbi:hypothetical protein FGL01_15640 [Flavobacterium glycines]|uniref:Uncharacterized protein n=1 Tax=Flavobacterium glycines TaxID=551990 RepID=A0A511CDR4_9FLAO|nr:hypothetical protein FGL01_15640 [Flavobacterium glycines]